MTNLELIFKLLNSHHWYGESETIQIAKGKYESPRNLKEFRDRIRRNGR